MIEVSDLVLYYPACRALDHVSFTVPDGQFLALIGKNGAGKTSVLRALCGIARCEGTVLYDGRRIENCRSEIAYLSERGSFPPEMTCEEYGTFLAGFFPAFDPARYRSLLDFFELPRTRPAGGFSHGQRSKLEAAAAFSKGARYILMDEPFSGRDLFTQKDFLKLLAAGLRTEETLLLATHDLTQIESFADRALILDGGRIAADTSIDALHEAGDTLTGFFPKRCIMTNHAGKNLSKTDFCPDVQYHRSSRKAHLQKRCAFSFSFAKAVFRFFRILQKILLTISIIENIL